MIHPNHEYWKDAKGNKTHVSELEDDHLKNIFEMIKDWKEKTMKFVAISQEMKRRKL